MDRNNKITSIWIYLCIVMLVTMLQGCTFVGKVVTGIKYIFYFFLACIAFGIVCLIIHSINKWRRKKQRMSFENTLGIPESGENSDIQVLGGERIRAYIYPEEHKVTLAAFGTNKVVSVDITAFDATKNVTPEVLQDKYFYLYDTGRHKLMVAGLGYSSSVSYHIEDLPPCDGEDNWIFMEAADGITAIDKTVGKIVLVQGVDIYRLCFSVNSKDDVIKFARKAKKMFVLNLSRKKLEQIEGEQKSEMDVNYATANDKVDFCELDGWLCIMNYHTGKYTFIKDGQQETINVPLESTSDDIELSAIFDGKGIINHTRRQMIMLDGQCQAIQTVSVPGEASETIYINSDKDSYRTTAKDAQFWEECFKVVFFDNEHKAMFIKKNGLRVSIVDYDNVWSESYFEPVYLHKTKYEHVKTTENTFGQLFLNEKRVKTKYYNVKEWDEQVGTTNHRLAIFATDDSGKHLKIAFYRGDNIDIKNNLKPLYRRCKNLH